MMKLQMEEMAIAIVSKVEAAYTIITMDSNMPLTESNEVMEVDGEDVDSTFGNER